MNESWQTYKQKNWQWRFIIIASLILLLAKPIANLIYRSLGLDKLYATSSTVMQHAGLADALGMTPPLPTELVIDVTNDTPNDYTVETKVSSGQINVNGHSFAVGEVKRITVKPYSQISNPNGKGDIIFLSAPVTGNKNQTCQEIHTLNYDLKNASQYKRPLAVSLSSISSRLECKDNAINPSNDEAN